MRAGFTLHDCADRSGHSARGEVCLTLSSEVGGVIVTRTQHDRLAAGAAPGSGLHPELQAVMNDALFRVLQALGFGVDPLAEHDVDLVRAVAVAGPPATVAAG